MPVVQVLIANTDFILVTILVISHLISRQSHKVHTNTNLSLSGWERWGFEKLSNLPKVIKPVDGQYQVPKSGRTPEPQFFLHLYLRWQGLD